MVEGDSLADGVDELRLTSENPSDSGRDTCNHIGMPVWSAFFISDRAIGVTHGCLYAVLF